MMTNNTTEILTKNLDSMLREKMSPLFEQYDQDANALLIPLKWKPLVLVIGNYSSGKSTLINELLGQEVQRTGQAPTDDCFTIVTNPERDTEEKELLGRTVVNDESMPFTTLRKFGESFLSHFRLKMVDSPILADMAFIDTPGMLDSVTEKDRGYDYLGVIGEISRLADLILLMFDPHKAGTIKETYKALRSTLPGATGEDRVIFVLNRIDECDTIQDLIKSFGTLCWNLSQMTGRKDIPRIFLTHAATDGEAPSAGGLVWEKEREELKKKILTAPKMRLNHLFEEVDRGVRELLLTVEALAAYKMNFFRQMQKLLKVAATMALILFAGGDMLLHFLTKYPETYLMRALFTLPLTWDHFILPAGGVLLVILATCIYIKQLFLPRYAQKALANVETLLPLETAYKRDLWQRVRDHVVTLLETKQKSMLFKNHKKVIRKIERFLTTDLRKIYEKIQQG